MQINQNISKHYTDAIMGTMASQITSLTIVYSTVYSDADQKKHQSSASLACVGGIHRGPVNSRHKWPETRKMFSFDDVIMTSSGNVSMHVSEAVVRVVNGGRLQQWIRFFHLSYVYLALCVNNGIWGSLMTTLQTQIFVVKSNSLLIMTQISS